MGIPLWAKILITITTCFLVGYLAGVSTELTIDTWYAALEKPAFSPSTWIFIPVWVLLYLLMGIAAGLVWHKGWEEEAVSHSLMVFLAQLVLNGLWSTVFFGTQSPVAGLVIIILLWIVLGLTILRFWYLSKVAAILLIPYLLWVTFVIVLNGAIVSLN